jgi:hypothetical protein
MRISILLIAMIVVATCVAQPNNKVQIIKRACYEGYIVSHISYHDSVDFHKNYYSYFLVAGDKKHSIYCYDSLYQKDALLTKKNFYLRDQKVVNCYGNKIPVFRENAIVYFNLLTDSNRLTRKQIRDIKFALGENSIDSIFNTNPFISDTRDFGEYYHLIHCCPTKIQEILKGRTVESPPFLVKL